MQNQGQFRVFVAIAITWSLLMMAFDILWSIFIISTEDFNGGYNSPVNRALGWLILASGLAQIISFILLYKANRNAGITILAVNCVAMIIALVGLAGPKALIQGFPLNLNVLFVIAALINLKRRPTVVS